MERTRILSIVVHRRYCGRVVLDRWGVAPRSMRMIYLRHMTARQQRVALRQRFAKIVRRFQPKRVVIACFTRNAIRLRNTAHSVAAEQRIPVEFTTVASARWRLTGDPRLRRRKPSRRIIIRGFFPELAQYISKDREIERYRGRNWDALTIALTALARHHPHAVLVMARSEAFQDGPFLRSVERRLRVRAADVDP